MSGIRHDRSVIEARGGLWPKLADAVHEDSVAIAQGLRLPDDSPRLKETRLGTPRNARTKAPRCEVEARRWNLGLTQKRLCQLAGVNESTLKLIESGRPHSSRSAGMIAAALSKAEADKGEG